MTVNGHLLIDHQTLMELEVFPAEADGTGLYQLLGRTRTPGGREALRTRLSAPFSDADSIRGAQDALRFVLTHTGACDLLLKSRELSLVERYLESRYATLPGEHGYASALRLWWTAFRYADLLREAREGTAAVRSLVRATLEFCQEARRRSAPRGLQGVIETLEASSARLGEVLGQAGPSPSGAGVLRLDTVLRREACPWIDQCLGAIYRLDAISVMAETTRARGWVFPEILDGSDEAEFSVAGLHHPLIDRPVANDVRFDVDSPLLFLTGPNMAGKTTFMKAVGLAVYLAQLGMGVPARTMRLAPFATLISGMSPMDSVRLGCSYFLSEVRRLRLAAESLASGRRALLLFDEIFRGTNFHDAIGASSAVVTAFAQCRTSATIISSHAAELVPRVQTLPGVALGHFDMKLAEGAPVYPYRLEEGAFTGQMAMVLLGQEKLLDILGQLPPRT